MLRKQKGFKVLTPARYDQFSSRFLKQTEVEVPVAGKQYVGSEVDQVRQLAATAG